MQRVKIRSIDNLEITAINYNRWRLKRWRTAVNEQVFAPTFFFSFTCPVSSYLASERKLQRDSTHVAIRAEGAERGQSADGQRGSGGKDRSRAQGRGGQAEILASGEGKSPLLFLL